MSQQKVVRIKQYSRLERVNIKPYKRWGWDGFNSTDCILAIHKERTVGSHDEVRYILHELFDNNKAEEFYTSIIRFDGENGNDEDLKKIKELANILNMKVEIMDDKVEDEDNEV